MILSGYSKNCLTLGLCADLRVENRTEGRPREKEKVEAPKGGFVSDRDAKEKGDRTLLPNNLPEPTQILLVARAKAMKEANVSPRKEKARKKVRKVKSRRMLTLPMISKKLRIHSLVLTRSPLRQNNGLMRPGNSRTGGAMREIAPTRLAANRVGEQHFNERRRDLHLLPSVSTPPLQRTPLLARTLVSSYRRVIFFRLYKCNPWSASASAWRVSFSGHWLRTMQQGFDEGCRGF
jgi:hypothetical protein